MKTLVFKAQNCIISTADINVCADIIKNGGNVALPTETVYGIAANAFDTSAVEKLYTAKNRPAVKPISVCVGSLQQAEEIAVFNDVARELFNEFMPGPLTIILPKKNCIPDIVTAGGDTVGLRLPDHLIVSALSNACGVPFALTSANLSGLPSPTNGATVVETLYGRVDAIIDGGATDIGKESTVISLAGNPRIIREGAVSKQALSKYLDL